MTIPDDPVKAVRAKEKAYQHSLKHKLMKRYGMTIDEYDELNLLQNGVCAICEQPEKVAAYSRRLCVDHDHETGIVRGLLCYNCNTAIGKFQDSPELLMKAANYLQERSK